MTEVRGSGIVIDLRPGWEADIGSRGPVAYGTQRTDARPTIMHVANFQLPPERGDYGGDLLIRLGPGDVFVSMIDFGPVTDEQVLFAREGIPIPLTANDFLPDAIVLGLPNRSAAQRFFRARGHGYCLYVVLGSHRERADVLDDLNDALATIRFEA